MADEDEDLVIDLNEPDEPPAKAPAKEPAAAQAGGKPPPVPGPGRAAASQAASAGAEPQTGLKDLETQLTAERNARTRVSEENRRLAAERDQAVAFAQEAERRGMSTYELYNEQQLAAANQQLESLTVQQETAMESGDFKLAADLNRQMHKLGGQLALLERDKSSLVQQRATMTARQQQRPPQTRQPAEPEPSNPLERAIAGRTEPTKNFLRKHPDLIRNDGSLKRAAIDAHERALDEGHNVDTQGYFDYIEKIIGGPTAMTNGQNRDYEPQPRDRLRAPMQAAPVERGSPPGSAEPGFEQPGTFVMTPRMRRLAEEQGVTPKEWATNYVRLLREGRITPIS